MVVTGSGEQIGLGWFIGTFNLGTSTVTYLSKNGGVPSFATQIDFAPSRNTGVVVFTNVSSAKGEEKIVDVQTIAHQVLQIINGAAPTAAPGSGDEP
jgi:hypothetical protein